MEAIQLRGNGWKKCFALTFVLIAAALVASAQTVTTLHSFTLDDRHCLTLRLRRRAGMATFTLPPPSAVRKPSDVFAGQPSNSRHRGL